MSGAVSGRRILVTGAAAGIGQAVAALFAQEGAALALLDREVGAVDKAHGAPVAVDVADETSVARAIAAAAEALGGIDGVVNVAGVFPVADLADTSAELFMQTLSVNLLGPFLVVRAALPYLAANESASIVNVGSASSISPFPGLTAYGASKGGLAAMTKVWAKELGPKIRVNIVAPGMTRTRMVADWHPDADKLAAQAKSTYALQRIAEPEEVANAVLYLMSSASSFTTGATLTVDGGRTFH